MNRFLLTTSLALSLGCGPAFAQMTDVPPTQEQAPATQGSPHHHHAPNPQRQAEFLSQRLNLTADQTSRIEPILATRDQQLQALRSNNQLSPEDRHQQMHTINEQAQQQMAGVLTPDQMAQLKQMRRHHRHEENGQDGAQTPSA